MSGGGTRAGGRAHLRAHLPGLDARRTRLLRAAGRERVRPRVRIALGPSVPVWLLRLLQAVVGLFCTAIVATNDVQWLFTVLALIAALVWPVPAWLAVLPLSWGIGLALLLLAPLSAPALLLLFGLHLYVVLGVAVGRAPASTRVEWSALAPAALRFVVLQVGAQGLAWLAATARTLELAAPWVPILAAGCIAVAAWLVTGRLLSAPADEEADGQDEQPGQSGQAGQSSVARRSSREDREPNRGDDGWSYHLDA